MTGQRIFDIFKPLIGAISTIFGFLPRFIFTLTWPLMELLPWKLGIALRYLWAKRLAKSCGENVVIETGVRITHWDKLELGSNVGIYETTYIDAKGGVIIGDNVSISHQVSLISFDFDIHNHDGPMKFAPMIKKPIVIGHDALIFAGARVFAGVELAPRTVIAANAVVRAGRYEPGIYAGMPASRKKDI